MRIASGLRCDPKATGSAIAPSDGDDHADVAVRELATIAEQVEDPGDRHHDAVLGADPALNGVEIGAGRHQLGGALDRPRAALDPAAGVSGLERDPRVAAQALVLARRR